MIKVKLIKRNTPEFEALLKEVAQLRWAKFPRDSGRRTAADSLRDKFDTDILLIREPLIDIPVGILSFREEDNGRFVKVVNMGVSKKNRGIGQALIEKVRKIAGKKRSVWLRSLDEDSDSFYEKIGGRPAGEHGFDGGKKSFQFSGT
jgi:hypothetical protein